jgi:hypothetical protein
MGLCGE